MVLNKNLYYLITLSIIILVSYTSTKLKNYFVNKDDDFELIKKYLLNDDKLYGNNKPKLWIHTKYSINSRKWKDFNSRNTNNLNQPYIYLTVKTIINNCGNDFNICLIDDETLDKLIPDWNFNINTMAEPMKSSFREYGLMNLLYIYGGMLIPNSFLCEKNMIDLYNENKEQPFLFSKYNRTINVESYKKQPLYIPDTLFIGCKKNDNIIKEYIEYYKKNVITDFFNNEKEFLGLKSEWWIEKIKNKQANYIDGKMIGIKSKFDKPILLDDLMDEDDYCNFLENKYGIYIPSDELLIRTKYNWFVYVSVDDLYNVNNILSKTLTKEISKYKDNENEKNIKKSIFTI